MIFYLLYWLFDGLVEVHHVVQIYCERIIPPQRIVVKITEDLFSLSFTVLSRIKILLSLSVVHVCMW